MTAALIAGLGLATGLLLILSGAFPAPLPVDRALAQLHRERTRDYDTPEESRLDRLLGRSWSESALGARITLAASADLRVTGQTATAHLAQRLAFGLLGLLWAPLVVLIMSIGGVRVGAALPLWVCVVLGPLGFAYPGLALRSAAAERRRGFRHALSAFLDVVAVSLASGRGVDTALRDGVRAGNGWPFAGLERALSEARLLGESPWTALARLSRAIGVPELAELAASAALAGNEGARVRSSLAAKARAIRVRGLAEVEGAAQSATERMTLPVVLLMVGFIVFLGYPAIDRVINGI
ncbi:MAG: type II secretion system F family protein [Acidimicrobiales bacterium]